MVDESCEYYDKNFTKIGEKIYFGCNVTHGFCNSDDHNGCEKYLNEKGLRDERRKNNLEFRSNG